jgi:hypothetical protein
MPWSKGRKKRAHPVGGSFEGTLFRPMNIEASLKRGVGFEAACVVLGWLPKAPPHRGGTPVVKAEEGRVVAGRYRYGATMGQIFRD